MTVRALYGDCAGLRVRQGRQQQFLLASGYYHCSLADARSRSAVLLVDLLAGDACSTWRPQQNTAIAAARRLCDGPDSIRAALTEAGRAGRPPKGCASTSARATPRRCRPRMRIHVVLSTLGASSRRTRSSRGYLLRACRPARIGSPTGLRWLIGEVCPRHRSPVCRPSRAAPADRVQRVRGCAALGDGSRSWGRRARLGGASPRPRLPRDLPAGTPTLRIRGPRGAVQAALARDLTDLGREFNTSADGSLVGPSATARSSRSSPPRRGLNPLSS